MAASSKKGQSKEHHYSAYKNEGMWRKNKIAALKRHIKNFPNDQQAQKAIGLLENNAVQYARKSPYKRMWQRNRAKMAFAKLVRFFGGNGNTVLTMPWELGHPQRQTILPTMNGARSMTKTQTGVEEDA